MSALTTTVIARREPAVNFTQTVTVKVDDVDALLALVEQWDDLHASMDVVGYMGARLLADLDDPGQYMLVANFAQVEPGVSAREEAEKNNDRPETNAWAEALLSITREPPTYAHYDELYTSL